MNCNICDKPIKGSCQAGAHVGCYVRANPPSPAKLLEDLVNPSSWNGDPVLARRELMKLITSNASMKAINDSIATYNKQLMQGWQRRCEIYPEGE